jgi:hypothetical protein
VNEGRGASGGGAVTHSAQQDPGNIGAVASQPGTKPLTNILKQAGFGPRGVDIAYAVAMAESSGNARSHNTNSSTGDNSYGLFQINMIGSMGPARRKQYHLKSNNDLFDPLTNAKVAYAMSNKGRDWSPWSTYKNGAYKKYLGKSGAAAGTKDSKTVGDNEPSNSATGVVGKSDLPRNAREAASWAIEQVKIGSSGWNNYCERFAETAWGKPHRYPSAIAHWHAAVKEGRAYQGKTPPPGAMVFWGGGQYGHAAVSIGGGKIVSTDIKRKGKADIVTIDYLSKAWNKKYLGWADPSKGTKLDKNASAVDPGSVAGSTGNTPENSNNNNNQPWWRELANNVGNFFGGNNNNSSSSSSNAASGNAMASGFNITGSGFTINSPSTSALLGMGSTNSMGSAGGSDGSITINMNVNIAHASTADAQRLARQVKDILQRDLRTDSIRNY